MAMANERCKCVVVVPHWPNGVPTCKTCGLSLDSGAEPISGEASPCKHCNGTRWKVIPGDGCAVQDRTIPCPHCAGEASTGEQPPGATSLKFGGYCIHCGQPAYDNGSVAVHLAIDGRFLIQTQWCDDSKKTIAEPRSVGIDPMPPHNIPIRRKVEAVSIYSIAARPVSGTARPCDWPFQGNCTQKDALPKGEQVLKEFTDGTEESAGPLDAFAEANGVAPIGNYRLTREQIIKFITQSAAPSLTPRCPHCGSGKLWIEQFKYVRCDGCGTCIGFDSPADWGQFFSTQKEAGQ